MDAPAMQTEDRTVARLAPEPLDEPELIVELKEAYLEEKSVVRELRHLVALKQAGWQRALASQIKRVLDADFVHFQALTQILGELGVSPPERPDHFTFPRSVSLDVREALSRVLGLKKVLEVRYVRASSLAAVDGRRRVTERLEALADQENAGRRTLLTVLSRYAAFRPEE